MPTLNDSKAAFLKDAGFGGSINDAWKDFLTSQLSVPIGLPIGDLERAYLATLGFPDMPRNDAWYAATAFA